MFLLTAPGEGRCSRDFSIRTGTAFGMSSLVKLASRTKRAAMVGLLLGLPLTACSDGGDSGDGGGSEVENGDTQDEEDDEGIY